MMAEMASEQEPDSEIENEDTTRPDGIFKNPQEVGQFVEGKIGAIKSIVYLSVRD